MGLELAITLTCYVHVCSHSCDMIAIYGTMLEFINAMFAAALWHSITSVFARGAHITPLVCVWALTHTTSSCYGACAQGDPSTATVYALLCFPIRFLIIIASAARVLWQLPAETCSSEAGETWREMVAEFCPRSVSFILVEFTNVS
jgi:hypothetical protein